MADKPENYVIHEDTTAEEAILAAAAFSRLKISKSILSGIVEKLAEFRFLRAWQLSYIRSSDWVEALNTPPDIAEAIVTLLDKSKKDFNRSKTSPLFRRRVLSTNENTKDTKPRKTAQVVPVHPVLSKQAQYMKSKNENLKGFFRFKHAHLDRKNINPRIRLQLSLASGISILLGLLILICGILDNGPMSLKMTWIAVGISVVLTGTLCLYGAERVEQDVLAETSRKPSNLIPFEEYQKERFDGLETAGQRIIQACIYIFSIIFSVVIVAMWATLSRSREVFRPRYDAGDSTFSVLVSSDQEISSVAILIASLLGACLLPLITFIIAKGVIIVSLFEVLQSLAEVFSLSDALLSALAVVAASFMINQILNLQQAQVSDNISAGIPAAILILSGFSLFISGYSFYAAWCESPRMLWISVISKIVVTAPLLLSLPFLFSFLDLGRYITANCKQFLIIFHMDFFDSFLSCSKYSVDVFGEVMLANGSRTLVQGIGESVFCGSDHASKKHASIVWEVSPFEREHDQKLVDYYGCLNYGCCDEIVSFLAEIRGFLTAASVMLLLSGLSSIAILEYLRRHCRNEAEDRRKQITAWEKQSDITVKVLSHWHTPYLTGAFFGVLGFIVASLLLLYYTSFAGISIEEYEDYSNKRVALTEACIDRTEYPDENISLHFSMRNQENCTVHNCGINDPKGCCVNGKIDGIEAGVDCGYHCYQAGGLLCPYNQVCESDLDCLSGCCNKDKNTCTLEACEISQQGFHYKCANGQLDTDIQETCSSGGGPRCSSVQCAESECGVSCNRTGYLCKELEACNIDRDCDNGLRCSFEQNRCVPVNANDNILASLQAYNAAPDPMTSNLLGIGQVCNSSSECSTLSCDHPLCHTVGNLGPPSSRHKPCRFPFNIDGTSYNGCIDGLETAPAGFEYYFNETSDMTRFWCSTESEYHGGHNNWGFCECRKEQKEILEYEGSAEISEKIQRCYMKTTGNAESPSLCQLPFTFNGKQFTECPTLGESAFLPSTLGIDVAARWCPREGITNITNISINLLAPENWGICSCETEFEHIPKVCQVYMGSDQICGTYEDETIACGGSCSLRGKLCSEFQPCLENRDCSSGICFDGTCVSCSDGTTNGFESDVDCGGPHCQRCDNTRMCRADLDCFSGSCNPVTNTCESCDDHQMNNGETCVDGGGASCASKGKYCTANDPCKDSSDCFASLECDLVNSVCFGMGNGEKDGEETDIDCGGTGKDSPRCSVGDHCLVNSDCLTLLCQTGVCTSRPAETMPISCNNSVFDVSESCVDGGGICNQWNRLCDLGSFVGGEGANDCITGLAQEGVCVSKFDFLKLYHRHSCFDGIINGDETDVDCGGICRPCFDGHHCENDSDCASLLCSENVCASCFDGIHNGDESDIDCGGSKCQNKCGINMTCADSIDCSTMICEDSVCEPLDELATITCVTQNGVKDEIESDVDCGGHCAVVGNQCEEGRSCQNDRDCLSHRCVDGKCTKSRRYLQQQYLNQSCIDDNVSCKGSVILSLPRNSQQRLQGRCTRVDPSALFIQSARPDYSFCPDPNCFVVATLSTSNPRINISLLVETESVTRHSASMIELYDTVGRLNSLLQELVVCEHANVRVLEPFAVILNISKDTRLNTAVASGECAIDNRFQSTYVEIGTLEDEKALPMTVNGILKSYHCCSNPSIMNASLELHRFCWPGTGPCQIVNLLTQFSFGWMAEKLEVDYRQFVGSKIRLKFEEYAVADAYVGETSNLISFGEINLPVCTCNSPSFPSTTFPTSLPSEIPSQNSSMTPTLSPLTNPTYMPSKSPITFPSQHPSESATNSPSQSPLRSPTEFPSILPTNSPNLSPSSSPTISPSNTLTKSPTSSPSLFPHTSTSKKPNTSPTVAPSITPVLSPSNKPTTPPTTTPTNSPSNVPITSPTISPSDIPTLSPSTNPTASPTLSPSETPTMAPSNTPTTSPTMSPSDLPTMSPSNTPTTSPTMSPSDLPTTSPSNTPTTSPTMSPSDLPTTSPSNEPTISPTLSPSRTPSIAPSNEPTISPTLSPSRTPSIAPSNEPTIYPTSTPSKTPIKSPSRTPSHQPTHRPSSSPSTTLPVGTPTESPITASPSESPVTSMPSAVPTTTPSEMHSNSPTSPPSASPVSSPTFSPSPMSFNFPSGLPSHSPSNSPSQSPSPRPTDLPTLSPSPHPSLFPTPLPSSYPKLSPSLAPSSSPSPGSFLIKSIVVRSSLCGGPVLEDASYIGGAIVALENNKECSSSCRVYGTGEIMLNFKPSSENPIWSPFNASINCSENNECTCLDSQTCETKGDGNFVFFTRDILPEGKLRACLLTTKYGRDMDLYVKFQTGKSTDSSCVVSTFRRNCGEAHMLQTNDEMGSTASREGVIFDQLYQSMYTLYVKNYLGDTATESSGLRLEVEGLGVSQIYELPLIDTESEPQKLFESWPGKWLGGMFRAQAQYARILCLQGHESEVTATWSPFFSQYETELLTSCQILSPVCDSNLVLTTFSQSWKYNAHTEGIVPTTKPTYATPPPGDDYIVGNGDGRKPKKVLYAEEYYSTREPELGSGQNLESEWLYKGETTVFDKSGSCPQRVSFQEAERICSEFSVSAENSNFMVGRLCSEDDLARKYPILNQACSVDSHYIWTDIPCAIESDSENSGKEGRLIMSGQPACGKGTCIPEYFGERCWHDGQRRKSCRKTWEDLGVFQHAGYLSTMDLCDLCKSDEDCKLFVYDGYWPLDPPFYDFFSDCETNSDLSPEECSEVIPPEKQAGKCSSGVFCGASQNFMTVEDGTCFISAKLKNRMIFGTNSCHCPNYNVTDKVMVAGLSRNGASIDQCIDVSNELNKARSHCCILSPESAFPSLQQTSLLQYEFPVATDNVYEDQIFIDAFADTSIPLLLNDAYVGVAAVNSTELLIPSCNDMQISAIPTGAEIKSFLVSAPQNPGMYVACLLRPTKDVICPNKPACEINNRSYAITPGTCTFFSIKCTLGWTGEKCFSCDYSQDSDGDEVVDCFDTCPFDKTKSNIFHTLTLPCGATEKHMLNDTFMNQSVRKTLSGIPCQDWSSKRPHDHGFLLALSNENQCSSGPNEYFPNAAPEGEPCKFPFVLDGVQYTTCISNSNGGWCNTNFPWEKEIVASPCIPCHTEEFAEKEIGNHNFCINPDGAPGGDWCFTLDPEIRWEYCTDVFAPDIQSGKFLPSTVQLYLSGSSLGVAVVIGNEINMVFDTHSRISVGGIGEFVFTDNKNYYYVGCFRKNADTNQQDLTDLSIEACASYCFGYPYFGLVSAKGCACISSMDEFAQEHLASDKPSNGCVTTGVGLETQSGIPCITECQSTGFEDQGFCFVDSSFLIWGRCKCDYSCDITCEESNQMPCGSANNYQLMSIYAQDQDCVAGIDCFFLTDRKSNKIFLYSQRKSRILFEFTSVNVTNPGPVLHTPNGEYIVVGNESPASIIIFDEYFIARYTINLGQYSSVLSLAADSTSIYVAAQDRGEVYVFLKNEENHTWECNQLTKTQGWLPGCKHSQKSQIFQRPTAVTISNSYLYVCDVLANSIYVFGTKYGNLIGILDSINYPRDIKIVESGMYIFHEINKLSKVNGTTLMVTKTLQLSMNEWENLELLSS